MKRTIVLFSALVYCGFCQAAATTVTLPQNLQTCVSEYALCDNTECVNNNDGTASCACPVYHGKNTGGTTCARRDATANAGGEGVGEQYVYSDYSPIHLITAGDHGVVAKKLADPTLLCAFGQNYSYQYADCFDVKCTVNQDSANGEKTASCVCPMIAAQKGLLMMIDGNNCLDSRVMCKKFTEQGSSVVVNSAPTLYGTEVVSVSLASYGVSMDSEMLCAPASAEVNAGAAVVSGVNTDVNTKQDVTKS